MIVRIFSKWWAIATLACLWTQHVHGAAPPVCASDSHWVKAHYRREYIRADGTRVSASSITAHCQKNPPGYSFWKDRIKHTSPQNWPIISEKAADWTPEEIERTLAALSQLPDALFLTSIRGVYRMRRSQNFPNPASNAFGDIVLYDSAFDKKHNLSRILSHELAHEYFKNLSKENLDSYQMALNWFSMDTENSTPRWISRGRSAFVSEDGRESPSEDFANNVEYYLFQKEILTKTTPHAKTWINKHFGDNFKLKGNL